MSVKATLDDSRVRHGVCSGESNSPEQLTHFACLNNLDPYYRLIAGIVCRAYMDLDLHDMDLHGAGKMYRESAESFFNNPPDYIPDSIIEFARKEREKNGKPIPPHRRTS